VTHLDPSHRAQHTDCLEAPRARGARSAYGPVNPRSVLANAHGLCAIPSSRSNPSSRRSRRYRAGSPTSTGSTSRSPGRRPRPVS